MKRTGSLRARHFCSRFIALQAGEGWRGVWGVTEMLTKGGACPRC